MRTSRYVFSALGLAVASTAPASFAQTTCNAYFTRSTALGALVTQAYTAMQAKDAAAYAKLLPTLESELTALSASEIKAEVCEGNHVNAYTVHQYAELSALKAHGFATGFPADLPIVKQPDLNHVGLAYSVGWIKYEQGNFDGALAAYTKGLAMFPHDASLQQEYLATLMQLARYADLIAYADKILSDGTGFDDEARAKAYSARAIAQFSTGDLKGADDMLGVSLKYHNTTETQDLQKQVRDALAKKAN